MSKPKPQFQPSNVLLVEVPPQFIALCEASGASPQAALRGMAVKVCGLQYDARKHLASGTLIPSYLLRHRSYEALLNPCCRHGSFTATPASASRRKPMICSSLNLFFTSNLRSLGNWTPDQGATQKRGTSLSLHGQRPNPAAVFAFTSPRGKTAAGVPVGLHEPGSLAARTSTFSMDGGVEKRSPALAMRAAATLPARWA
jgi:hypothetical protein